MLLHFICLAKKQRDGLVPVHRTGYTWSDGVYPVEQTDLVEQTGYVDQTG